jgi:hypothetical protein
MTHIDRKDLLGPRPEENLGKTPCGGANIHAPKAISTDSPLVQCCSEFMRTAPHVVFATGECHLVQKVHLSRSFVGWCTIDGHITLGDTALGFSA